ncbi:MAG: hypothetical protein RDV48_28845 [Candidatus Eremiobacteraeota bacterium]|nr:hypothetical protein [Candidatus Eremiobacteraeota bacterium]
MEASTIHKALEIWTLQTLLDVSIVLGMAAMALALVQQYYRSLEKLLTLRVSIEVWKVTTTLVVDVLLAVVVAAGYLVLNPDIMADIKIALPFVPAATILFAIALVLRLFHGGHHLSHKNFLTSLWCMFLANILNIVGFTFVMEAPAKEYLQAHPSPFWIFLKTQLRSNVNLELSQLTFLVAFPLLILVFLWGFRSALGTLKKNDNEQP